MLHLILCDHLSTHMAFAVSPPQSLVRSYLDLWLCQLIPCSIHLLQCHRAIIFFNSRWDRSTVTSKMEPPLLDRCAYKCAIWNTPTRQMTYVKNWRMLSYSEYTTTCSSLLHRGSEFCNIYFVVCVFLIIIPSHGDGAMSRRPFQTNSTTNQRVCHFSKQHNGLTMQIYLLQYGIRSSVRGTKRWPRPRRHKSAICDVVEWQRLRGTPWRSHKICRIRGASR